MTHVFERVKETLLEVFSATRNFALAIGGGV